MLIDIDHINLVSINTVSLILRLSLATICGGLIGFERGKKNHAAGFRTHILVCIGSTLAMMTNQYIMQTFNTTGDPSRIGAQVISGIGFIGAGTILITGKQQVKGLTTAAGLWASACMGLAIGIGFYEGAIISCVFIFIVITVLQRVDEKCLEKSKVISIYIEVINIRECKNVLNYLRQNCSKIYSMEINRSKNQIDDTVGMICTLKLNEKRKYTSIMDDVSMVTGVEYVEIV